MSELQNRLDRLWLRLNHMGMMAEQAVLDALDALLKNDVQAGLAVEQADYVIDREEVEIEQDCIRLLALYQPAAVDLRNLCAIIKVNSDLERIADFGSSIGQSVGPVVENQVDMDAFPPFYHLTEDTKDVLSKTVRMISGTDIDLARRIIAADDKIDEGYRKVFQRVVEYQNQRVGGAGPALIAVNLAKALERIGDMCRNIAEDIVFLRTGDIIRHADSNND